MNDQQLEAAARHACKLLSMDPDDEAYRWVPEEQCEVRAKNWQFFTTKIREQWAINSALIESGAGIAQVENISKMTILR